MMCICMLDFFLVNSQVCFVQAKGRGGQFPGGDYLPLPHPTVAGLGKSGLETLLKQHRLPPVPELTATTFRAACGAVQNPLKAQDGEGSHVNPFFLNSSAFAFVLSRKVFGLRCLPVFFPAIDTPPQEEGGSSQARGGFVPGCAQCQGLEPPDTPVGLSPSPIDAHSKIFILQKRIGWKGRMLIRCIFSNQ